MLNREDLIKKVKNYNKFLHPEILSKAYTFALTAHKHQKRESGDPYLVHPVAVADILCDLKLDTATITTELPHKLSEVVEQDKINLDQLSKMALEDPSTSTNPKKMTVDDMKILYEHSISGKLF